MWGEIISSFLLPVVRFLVGFLSHSLEQAVVGEQSERRNTRLGNITCFQNPKTSANPLSAQLRH